MSGLFFHHQQVRDLKCAHSAYVIGNFVILDWIARKSDGHIDPIGWLSLGGYSSLAPTVGTFFAVADFLVSRSQLLR